MLAKERPTLFRDLPKSFKVGHPLPVHSLTRWAIRYSAHHMISGKLVESVEGGGALAGCETAGALVESVESNTVS